VANLKYLKAIDFKYFTEDNGIKNDYFYACAFIRCSKNL